MRWLAGFTIVVLLAGVAAAAPAPAPVEVKSSLEGDVVEVVAVNAAVKETDALLYVRTATRARAVAASAPADGTITEVRVKVGDRVRIGAVVAILQPR